MANQFGDFQTPYVFAKKVVNLIKELGYDYQNVIEPTFGDGNFIKASTDVFNNIESISGLEIQKEHFLNVRKYIRPDIKYRLWEDDFFNFDIDKLIELDKTNLVIGNPPWVTTSQLGSLNSTNMPIKKNIRNLSGYDAMTGKSNFDISEYIAIQLLTRLNSLKTKNALALLVKTSVAKNILKYLPNLKINPSKFKLYNLNSKKIFNVSVDSCLMLISFNDDNFSYNNKAEVFNIDEPNILCKRIGWVDDKFVSDVDSYFKVKYFDKSTSWDWRSGMKHDISKVMEFTRENNLWINGFGEKFSDIELDNTYIHPLIKSSDVRKINRDFKVRKYVLVTQKRPDERTEHIKEDSPTTWEYLTNHLNYFSNRKSSIYKSNDIFSIFGIGDYSFKPYKVVISSMYKEPTFSMVPYMENKPVMLDDTVYSISFDSEIDASIFLSVVTGDVVKDLLNSIAFKDAKRPYTKEILQRIDIVEIIQANPLNFIDKDKGIDIEKINIFIEKYKNI